MSWRVLSWGRTKQRGHKGAWLGRGLPAVQAHAPSKWHFSAF